MKIRNGFVSNSSSSSFLINRKALTPKLLEELDACIVYDSCNKLISTDVHISKDHVRLSRWYTKGFETIEKKFPRDTQSEVFYQYCQETHYNRLIFGREIHHYEVGRPIMELIQNTDDILDGKDVEKL